MHPPRRIHWSSPSGNNTACRRVRTRVPTDAMLAWAPTVVRCLRVRLPWWRERKGDYCSGPTSLWCRPPHRCGTLPWWWRSAPLAQRPTPHHCQHGSTIDKLCVCERERGLRNIGRHQDPSTAWTAHRHRRSEILSIGSPITGTPPHLRHRSAVTPPFVVEARCSPLIVA